MDVRRFLTMAIVLARSIRATTQAHRPRSLPPSGEHANAEPVTRAFSRPERGGNERNPTRRLLDNFPPKAHERVSYAYSIIDVNKRAVRRL